MPRSAVLCELCKQLFCRDAFFAVSLGEGLFKLGLEMCGEMYGAAELRSVNRDHGALGKRSATEDNLALFHSAGEELHRAMLLQCEPAR